MDSIVPLLGLAAFLGVLAVIVGLGWFLKNKTPLGEYGVGRPSFSLRGSYRLDAKNKLHIFTVDEDKFIVATGPASICLIDKTSVGSGCEVAEENASTEGERFSDHFNRTSAG